MGGEKLEGGSLAKEASTAGALDQLKAAHTPGPWAWFAEDVSMATLCRKSDGAYGCDPFEGHVLSVTICKSCQHGRDHWEWGQCYTAKAADARLIAAAPDLLEALKGYREALLMGPLEIAAKYGPDFNPDDVVIVADKIALAAIAKAEGTASPEGKGDAPASELKSSGGR